MRLHHFTPALVVVTTLTSASFALAGEAEPRRAKAETLEFIQEILSNWAKTDAIGHKGASHASALTLSLQGCLMRVRFNLMVEALQGQANKGAFLARPRKSAPLTDERGGMAAAVIRSTQNLDD